MRVKQLISSVFGVAVICAASTSTRADEITDWNKIMVTSFAKASVSPLAGTRLGAIVQGSVFDAVNGIERDYTPLHVAPEAPRGASKEAAAIAAAHAALSGLFPAQKAELDAALTESLGRLHGSDGSIGKGLEWGKGVAQQILAWRAGDGITPPPPAYTGGLGVGEWRPTPAGFLPGAGVQFSYMEPWVMSSPSQVRPPGPPALGSLRYVQDYVEVKLMGSSDSTERTADETLYANFWNSTTVAYFWNTVAQRLSEERHLNFSENARLFAHLNVGMADAGIACFEGKYHYSFWRPVTAITLGDGDGNDDTVGNAGWQPLLVTPNHPDYPSGHSVVSGGAITVLEAYFGANSSFWMDTDDPAMAGVIRSFSSFDQCHNEIANARIFAGIHFRSACEDGFAAGTAVGNYVVQNSLQRVHGHD